MGADRMVQSATPRKRHLNALSTANTAQKIAIERGFTYSSITYSEVPATGMVRSAATSATPAHRALGCSKSCPESFQHAKSRRKIARKCQKRSTKLRDAWEIRTDAAIKSGYRVSLACVSKNSEPKGNRDGFRIFRIPGL